MSDTVVMSTPKKSYFCQKDESDPKSNKSLPELFEEAASREDQNYVTWHRPAERYTYRELYQKAQKVAKGLIAAGLKRGDCVMGVGCQGSDGVVMFMASVSVGLIFCCPGLFTPVTKTLPSLIHKTEAKLILVGDITRAGGIYTRTFMVLNDWLKEQSDAGKTLPLVYYDSITATLDDCMECNLFAQPLSSLVDGGCSISDEKLNQQISATGCDDACFYAHSSGSTGEPKTIVLAARHFTNTTYQKERLQFTKDNVVYGITNMTTDDLFIAFEFVGAIQVGYPCVIVPSLTQDTNEDAVQEICECIEKHRISFANIDQCIIRSITLNRSIREMFDLSSMKGWILTAAPLSEGIKKEIMNDYPLTSDCLGSSELCVITFQLPGNNIKKPNSVGRPNLNFEVKICDDHGNIVDRGISGRLYVRSPTLFICYKDQPELTKSMFNKDNWFDTGDRVRMDEDGDLYFISRMSKTERYKVWGDIVYAAPIEHVLMRNSKIKECAVIGILSDGRIVGHELCYCIVQKEQDSMTMNEISRYAVENMNDQREWPKRVIFMDELPRQGARKKVAKLKLIERFEKELKEDDSLYMVKDSN